jgi:putative zinc finger/helix-turn-helix YgiT family protein
MICLRCDNDQFLPKRDAVIEQEFRGETFRIQTPALACSKCEWITIDPQQADELRKRTADAYRKKHGLLTSEEIKAYRKLLRKNQREFAAFLGVGEASVKRWETWLPQEKGNDNLIRMKCENALIDQIAQKATPNVWISFEVSTTMAPHGITIQNEQPKAATPSFWDVTFEVPEQTQRIQMQFRQIATFETSGLSPPSAHLDWAFSFSTPSPDPFQTEGVEKENASQFEHSGSNGSIALYGTTAPSLSLATQGARLYYRAHPGC